MLLLLKHWLCGAAYLHGIGQHPRQSERDLFRKFLSGHGNLWKVTTALIPWWLSFCDVKNWLKRYLLLLQNSPQSRCGGSFRSVGLTSGWRDAWNTKMLFPCWHLHVGALLNQRQAPVLNNRFANLINVDPPLFLKIAILPIFNQCMKHCLDVERTYNI